MPRLTSLYICQQCNYRSPQYLGKCPECGTWNSLVETVEEVASTQKEKQAQQVRTQNVSEVINLAHLKKNEFQRLKTGLAEVDRVLGGGVVLGSIVLISGDPGIGKSTLLSQISLNIPKALYIAGEESAQQIKIRIDRLQKDAELAVLNEVDVDVITGVIDQVKPPFVIVDSIQTLQTQDLNGIAGSVGQVRECAQRLQQIAKKLHVPIFLVGHVTKEGTMAGPRTLEHLVDVVLSLEGDSAQNFRVLRASKNRFGPTDEVGIFEMEEAGMIEVTNPSRLFLDQRVEAPGAAVIATMNGYRPLLVEIQALVTKSFLPVPRRVGTGIDNNRLQLLVAVLQKRLGLQLYDQDVFVNVTGGLRIVEPAADLGICMAIASSLKDKTLDSKAVFVGEIGLLGELREIRGLDRRTAEAKNLGFTKVISTKTAKSLSEIFKIILK